ncbi:MAG: glycosyltransferase [Planctomycetota bacterium]
MARVPRLAYVGAVLPKRSETFVYREMLGLRERGHDVLAVSLRTTPREEFADDETLKALAAEAVVVYRRGFVARGLTEALRHPLRATRAKWRLFTAALQSGDLGLREWVRFPVQLLGGLALASDLRQRGVQHLHAHMAHSPTTIAMVAADALGAPFSFTGHAADLFRDRALLKAKLRRAAFVACISEWHRGWYRDVEAELSDAQLPVVRCGVDLDAFAPDEPTSDERGLREPVVLAVGRLVPKKGFDVLLRAWATWLQNHGFVAAATTDSDKRATAHREQPATRSTGGVSGPICVIMGDGPEADALRALAQDLRIGDHVQFTGAANQRQVRAAMRGCDVFTLPCQPARDGDRDGIPVVLMEAMACGKPVIGGDLPAIRELLSDNSGARRVPPGNEVMLLAALEELLQNSETRKEAGRLGRTRVAEEFSARVNLDRLEAAFARSTEGAAHGRVLGGDPHHG